MNHNLMLGDCLDVMRQIQDKTIDFIYSDLPYGLTHNAWDRPINLEKLWGQYLRIIKDNGCIALWAQSPFDKVLACSQLDLFRYEWIIKKTNATGFLNSHRMPMKAHEKVLIFYKHLPKYNPQKTTGHPRKVSLAEHKRNCKKSTNYGEHQLVSYDSTERFPLDVLEFKWDKQKSKLHPTQKPLAACEYFIKTYTDVGDIVLDNCMGGGSTGVSCVNTNRNFIGIEKDPHYFLLAKNRIEEAMLEQER